MVGVLLHARQEEGQRVHEGVVVHDRVPLVAAQPLGGVAVVLRDDEQVGVDGLHPASEFLPEQVVELPGLPQVSGHVQPPAVDGERGPRPLLRHLQYGLAQGAGLLVVELGQGVHVPPAMVVPLVLEREVAPVRALHVAVCALVGVIDALAVQPAVEGAAVVEHAVQYDLHAPAVQLPAELGEPLVAGRQVGDAGGAADVLGGLHVVADVRLQRRAAVAGDDRQVRVHVVVVLGVVLVRRRGHEQRIEVDGLHAQRFQIVQLLAHAHQVAAVVTVEVVRLGQGVPGRGVADGRVGVIVLTVHHVVLGAAVAEAVGQNLILHRALGPLGHVEAGDDRERPHRVRRGHVADPPGAHAVEVDVAPLPLHEEGIEHGGVPAVELRLVPVEAVVGLVLRHQRGLAGKAAQQRDLRLRALLDAQAHGDVLPALRLRGLAKQRRAVGKYGG